MGHEHESGWAARIEVEVRFRKPEAMAREPDELGR
jgi:hypothetical protein